MLSKFISLRHLRCQKSCLRKSRQFSLLWITVLLVIDSGRGVSFSRLEKPAKKFQDHFRPMILVHHFTYATPVLGLRRIRVVKIRRVRQGSGVLMTLWGPFVRSPWS